MERFRINASIVHSIRFVSCELINVNENYRDVYKWGKFHAADELPLIVRSSVTRSRGHVVMIQFFHFLFHPNSFQPCRLLHCTQRDDTDPKIPHFLIEVSTMERVSQILASAIGVFHASTNLLYIDMTKLQKNDYQQRRLKKP